jgi:hypothetical protein
LDRLFIVEDYVVARKMMKKVSSWST